MSSSQEKYWMFHTASEKYISQRGYVSDKSLATCFTIEQIKKRLGLPKTAKATFENKLRNSGFAIRPVSGIEDGGFEVVKNATVSYNNDDIVSVDAEYHYENKVVKKRISYSEYRGNLKIPMNEKGKLRKIVLNIFKVTGRVVK